MIQQYIDPTSRLINYNNSFFGGTLDISNSLVEQLNISSTYFTSVNCTNCSYLTFIQYIGNSSNNPPTNILASINLTNCNSLKTIQIRYSSLPSSFSMAGHPSLTFAVLSNNSFTSVDLSNIPTLTLVDINTNPLTTVNLTGTTLNSINFIGCSLIQASVDNVLIAADVGGQINGAVNLSGANSPPSIAGLNTASNLNTKGWSVIIN